jgi:RHS repeat-associated protein
MSGALGYQDTGLAPGVSYEYRVKAYNYTGESGFGDPVQVHVDNSLPAVSSSGLRLWLKADVGTNNGGGLVLWKDQSGLNKNAYGSTSSSTFPTVVASGLNGMPVVRFDGGDLLDLTNFMSGAQAGEVIAVLRAPNAPTRNDIPWCFGTSTEGTLYYGSTTYDDFGSSMSAGPYQVPDIMLRKEFHVYNTWSQPGEWVNRMNGVVQKTRTVNAVAFRSNPILGKRFNSSEYLLGDIAEILVYDRVLSATEREAAHFYLYRKYQFGLEMLGVLPASGLYSTPQSVSLISSNLIAEIYYTLDGSVPAKGISPVYAGPIVISTSSKLRAIAYVGDQITSNELVALYRIGDAPSATTALSGLSATYFQGDDFSGSSTRRIDSQLNNPSFTTLPSGWQANSGSARWEGDLIARFTENHVFTLTVNGGVRIWFGGQLVVDDWSGATSRILTFSRSLTAGSSYPLKVEFQRKSASSPVLTLQWSGFSTVTEVVPQSQLLSGLAYASIAATPMASPAAGLYGADIAVELATASPVTGARFHYTLDGSEPTDASALYTGPITLNQTTTLKAKAYANGYVESGTLVAAYTFDNQPPVLSALTFNGGAVPATIMASGSLGITATDASGIQRVAFHLDGTLLANDTIGADGFTAPFSIEAVTDGARTLTVQAWDNAGTPSAVSTFTLNVALPSPLAPVITAPTDDQKVNQAAFTVRGTAQKNSLVTLYREGSAIGTTQAAADGSFSLSITLVSGLQQLTATATNRNPAPGPLSSAVGITYDSTVPAPPSGLTATARSGGQIRLSWSQPATGLASGYYLFRSTSPISDTFAFTPSGSVGGQILRSTSYTDTPSTDGRYYYRVLTAYTVGSADTLSAPSNQADTFSDRIAPTATVTLQSIGAYHDDATQRLGRGLVQATVTVSERLSATPFFNLTTTGSALFVDLSAQGETTYTGVFNIQESTPSGALGAVFSALDLPGNRGTAITLTTPVVIDTAGPRITGLTPGRIIEGVWEDLPAYNSIRNEPVTPETAVTLLWRITLDEASKPGTEPVLTATFSSQPATALPLTLTDAGDADIHTWIATLVLPATAGADVETLTLGFSATDDLENAGSTIVPPHTFQVYQGNLPPLAVPAGLMAEPLPAGAVYLEWEPVSGASAYVLQVKGPSDSDFIDLQVLVASAVNHTYTPATDGTYAYRLASVHTENGQDSNSGWSAVASARSDRVSPPAPTGLALAVVAQGVQATWTAPAAGLGDVAGYSLYRHTTAITSITGLAPALETIVQTALTATDPSPAGATPHYAIVAYDEAGNRSEPATSFANVTLLPVRTLAVIQSAANAAPVLSWGPAPGSVIDGFKLSIDGSLVAVDGNETIPFTTRSYVDAGYGSGDRQYVLTTVSGPDSRERSLVMPAVSLSLAPGSELKRGLMNTLNVLVRNDSTASLVDARLAVRVAGRDHTVSAPVSLAAGAETMVSVVIGGYDDLPSGTASVTLTFTLTPHAGETVTLVRSAHVTVAEGALTVELIPGEFTRGGTGKVRFKLTNPGSQPIEFKSAIGQGAQSSDEVRIKVSDTSGALLSATSLKLVLGDDVVALPGGVTVVRVAAGSTYTSPDISVPVPATAPATITVSLEVDSVYYDFGGGTQVKLKGPKAQASASTLETSYTAALTAGTGITPLESSGDVPVTISGQARWRSIDGVTPGAPAPGVPVLVSIRNNGFVRTESVFANASGAFTYTFQPGATEPGGVYDVWVSHPDAVSAPAEPATFTIRRVLVSPLVFNITAPRNYRQTLPVTISTGAGTIAQNLRAELVETLPEAFSLTTTPLALVPGGQTVSLPLSIVGLAATATSLDTGMLHFKVVSDDGQGGTLEWATLTLNYHFTAANPSLQVSPTAPQIGVQPGQTASETIVIKNQGYAALEGGTVSLVPLAGAPELPNWIRLQTNTALGTLDIGESKTVQIAAAAPTDALLVDQVYSLYLRVAGTNHAPLDTLVTVTVSPSGQGGALFKIVDPYYQLALPNGATNASFNGLVNVPVTLEKESSTGISTVTRSLRTDASGEASFEDLPAGRYKLRITSPKHETYQSRVTIKSGVILAEQIQMTYTPVSFSWEVVPVTFQDRYEVNVTATFETNVPVPVVVVEPASINLPKMCAGQVYNGEFRITNHGLISADSVTIPLPPSDEYFLYELLGTFGDKIAAGQTVKVAYRVKCLKPLPGDCPELGVTGGSGEEDVPCATYSKCFPVTYHYACPNGQEYSTSVTVCIYRAFGKCLGTAAGGGAGAPPFNGGYGGAVTSYTGGGGGNGGIVVSGSTTVANDDCFPRLIGRGCGGAADRSGEDCDENASPMRQSCSGAGSSKDAAMENIEAMEALANVLPTGHHYEDSTDVLDIPVPGGNVSVSHSLQGQSWGSSISDQVRGLEFTGGGGNQGFALARGGVAYLPFGFGMGSLGSEAGPGLLARPAGDAPAAVYRENGGLNTITKHADGSLLLNKPNGETIGYDTAGRMISRGNRTGVFATYHYSEDGLLSHITDRNGEVVASMTYTGGRLATVTDAGDRQVVYSYDQHGRMGSITQPGGITTSYTYDNWSQVTGIRQHVAGTDVDEDEVTTIQYDNVSETPVVVLPPDKILNGSSRAGDVFRGHVTSISTTVKGVTASRTFSYKYNAADRTYYTRVVTSTGREEEFVLNANGTLISKLVNGEKVYSMEEDAHMRVTTIGDGQRITEEYDDQARLVRRVNSDGGIERWEHDPVLNKIIRYTDPFGAITANTYDAFGNVLTKREAVGTSLERVTTYVYDPVTHLLTTQTNPDGRRSSFEYDEEGSVLRSYDPDEPVRELRYTYDSLGHTKTTTDALGRVTHYVHDELGRLRELTNALGEQELYTYEGANLVEEEKGRLPVSAQNPVLKPGRITRYRYGLNNLRTAEIRVRSDGTTYTYKTWAYDTEGRVLSETNAIGQTITFAYDAAGNVISRSIPGQNGEPIVTRYEYDLLGRATKQIDPAGNVTQTTYNSSGALASLVEAAGTPIARTTTHTYDFGGRVLSRAMTGPAEPDRAYTTTYGYDLLGHRTSMGGTSADSTAYAYDVAGRLISETDARGYVTTYEYHPRSSLLTAVKREGRAILRQEHDLVGNLIKVIDGEGNHQHFRYDALNRRTHDSISLAPADELPVEWWLNPACVVTQTVYDRFSYVVEKIQPTVLDGVVSQSVTRIHYDDFGRITSEEFPTGITVTHAYDLADFHLETSYPPVTSSGSTQGSRFVYLRSPHNGAFVESTIDRAGYITQLDYDAAGRLVSEISAQGGVTTREYDALGRTVKLIDPDGKVSLTRYNLLDKPLGVTHPDHVEGTQPRIETFNYDTRGLLLSTQGAGGYPITYTYDQVGNRITSTTYFGPSAIPQVTTWTYNERNLVEVKTYADNKSWLYTYDDAGRLLSRTDAINRITTYEHTPAGLLATIDYANDADVTFTYDQQGRRLDMQDGTGRSTWTYNDIGQLVDELQPLTARRIARDYDTHGQRVALEVNRAQGPPQPWRTTYGYDNAGRLRTVLDDRHAAGQPYLYSYPTPRTASAINALAQSTPPLPVAAHDFHRITTPYGQVISREIDPLGRTRVIEASSAATGGQTLARHAYTYDAAGQRESETTLEWSRSFTYDAFRQLTLAAETAPATNASYAYSYDSIGNRLTSTVTGSSASSLNGTTAYIANSLNQYETLTGRLSATPTYDDNGNTRSLLGKTLIYDDENRLAQVADLERTVYYVYDGLGRRVERRELSSVGAVSATRYVYDSLRVIEELAWTPSTSSWTLRASYTRGLDGSGTWEGAGGVGGLLALVKPEAGGTYSAASYVHDGNGNVTALLAENGAAVARYQYSPFGETISATGVWTDLNPYRFSAKEQDAATGFYYYGFRFYDPSTGRWLNRDPIEEQGGPNLYGFVGNNAINRVDFFGLDWASSGGPLSVPVPGLGLSVGEASASATAGALEGLADLGGAVMDVVTNPAQALGELGSMLNFPDSLAEQLVKGAKALRDLLNKNCAVKRLVDALQLGLDVVGLIPLFGEIADGLNAAIYVARGDYVGAALSAAAMIPVIGWGATAAKAGYRVGRNLASDAIKYVAEAAVRTAKQVATGVSAAATITARAARSTASTARTIYRAAENLTGNVVRRVSQYTAKINPAKAAEKLPGPVVIGETMARVEAAAVKIPGSKILNDMPDFKAAGMAPHEVTNAMMAYNRKWILEQMRSGRPILDIGRDAARARPSIFYDMEQNMLKNYQKLHPEFKGAATANP